MRRRGFLAGLVALAVAPRVKLEEMAPEVPPAPPVRVAQPLMIQHTVTSFSSFPINFSSDEIRAMLRRGHL